MEKTYYCPYCKEALEIPAGCETGRMECPQCNREFVLDIDEEGYYEPTVLQAIKPANQGVPLGNAATYAQPAPWQPMPVGLVFIVAFNVTVAGLLALTLGGIGLMAAAVGIALIYGLCGRRRWARVMQIVVCLIGAAYIGFSLIAFFNVDSEVLYKTMVNYGGVAVDITAPSFVAYALIMCSVFIVVNLGIVAYVTRKRVKEYFLR